jgi:hypothetical protein
MKGNIILDEIYKSQQIEIQSQDTIHIGKISEKEKFMAAKQILLGIAVLYVLTIIVYIYRPVEGSKLIDICTTTFPPLATLILVAYFRDKN